MRSTLSYFALLGISEDASQEEIEERHRELADYLASPSIPPSLREWASKQAALVDEAYAVLADAEQRAAVRLSQTRAGAEARRGRTPTGAPDRLQEREPRERVERRARAKPGSAPRPSAGSREQRSSGILALLLSLRSQPLFLGLFIGLVVLGAVLFAYFTLPGGDEVDDSSGGQTSELVPLDTELVAELMVALQQDPNNPDVLFDLGESYFWAGEWQLAIDWFTKLLAVDPSDVHAQADIGTANFNMGRYEEAQATWLAALEIAPNDAQIHYNLGFLYASVEPIDLASARREWQLVVELAPDSDLAEVAQQHLQALPEASPAAAP